MDSSGGLSPQELTPIVVQVGHVKQGCEPCRLPAWLKFVVGLDQEEDNFAQAPPSVFKVRSSLLPMQAVIEVALARQC